MSRNPFVVFEELLSNAIDSFLIRKDAEAELDHFKVNLLVTFFPSTLFEDQFDMAVKCTDNGVGLADEPLEAFLTKDTSYKDDLAVSGLGQCKGAGRIQFFHFFRTVSIKSVYRTAGEQFRRFMVFDGSRHLITAGDFQISSASGDTFETTLTLDGLKESAAHVFKNLGDVRGYFSCSKIRTHLLVAFLQRLVALSGQLGEFEIEITTKYADQEESKSIGPLDLPKKTSQKTVTVVEQDPLSGEETGAHQTVSITHYKLDAEEFSLPKNIVSLCAKSSPVENITSRYLKDRQSEVNPLAGFYHLILVEGGVLDSNVNEERDGFILPNALPSGDLFESATVSMDAIYDGIDESILELLGPVDWSREEVVASMEKQFGVSETMREETDTRIRYGETARSVVERVLKKYQDRIIEDTAEIFSLREAIETAEPDSEDFREKIDQIAWKFTTSIGDIDKANLSQLVVRRSAIVEVLALAVRKGLALQTRKDGKRRKDEALIHNIFFPMRSDSIQTENHDIWLLDEEYQYFKYIASDMPLSKIVWTTGDELFEPDIDEELAKLLKKNEDANAGKRPDIALFHEEGAAIIIEFKAPDVSMDDHTGDLMEYAQLLAAKSKGRLRQFYGYLIGETVNPNRLRGFNRFPNGRGFFGTEPIVEYHSQRSLGELYSEIMFYEDVVERARNRLKVFSDRLGINV